MPEGPGSKKGKAVVRFLASPLHGRYPPPMTHVGDYFAVAGLVLFCVSVFGLKWITVGVKDVLGIRQSLGLEGPTVSFGLFESPWAWGMVAVLVLVVVGLWFVQTRGGITLGAGIYCLCFNVLFYVGAWQKINAIIGDIERLARAVPFIGEVLSQAVSQMAKEFLLVRVSLGYWLFIPAGLLLVAGGSLRLASRPREMSGVGSP